MIKFDERNKILHKVDPKNINQGERSCNKCIYKENDCGMWEGDYKNKEVSDTGWERNRIAIHCFEYVEQ